MALTFGTLKEQIRDLGFEQDDTIAEDEYRKIILSSCNRAIALINSTLKPIVDKYTISRYPLENVVSSPYGGLFDIVPYIGNALTFSGTAKAYYFECDGNGTATIVDADGTRTVTMVANGIFTPYRGFLNGNSTITFSGNFAYNVRNVAMYKILTSANVIDIPAYTQNVRYDISELTKVGGKPVFMDFLDSQSVLEGNFSDNNSYSKINDYHIEGNSTIVLKYDDIGQLTVWFKKRPSELTSDTPDTFEIELHYIVQPLVCLLASHYIWLDDEERKATLYWNEYDDLKNQIMGNASNQQARLTIKNTTGWWE